ncbi:MAG: substrate-binding domain-containing protein, partial [Anaerolineae bacterium]|nr:substrate-binding domain-containing protein [Anaerolineae bacterium]
DMRFAAFTVPALSTVRAPEVELGRVSAETLLAQIAGEPMQPKSRLLKTELIIRKSCGGRM